MINNILLWFKIIAGKINKIPEFYTIFARKMPHYIIRQRDRGQAEAKTLRPRPKLRGLEDLTSLPFSSSTGVAGHTLGDGSKGVHFVESIPLLDRWVCRVECIARLTKLPLQKSPFNMLKCFRQIDSFYRGGFGPHILKI